MVTLAALTRRTGLVCGLALLSAGGLHAGNFSIWHPGDIAEQNIITPVALDVADATATAKRKAEAALQTPVIYLVIDKTASPTRWR